MTYLTAHLPFPPSSSLPPAASHLIISDTLNSPAQFALYHLVNAALLKQKSQSPSLIQTRQTDGGGAGHVVKVIWVDFRGEGRSSWEVVLKKLVHPFPSSPVFIHQKLINSSFLKTYRAPHSHHPPLPHSFTLLLLPYLPVFLLLSPLTSTRRGYSLHSPSEPETQRRTGMDAQL